MPAISVIVPVYQAERLLPQCVESVLAQTFSDWELLLVDDGSRDGSPALCDAYAARDARDPGLSQAQRRRVQPPAIWGWSRHGGSASPFWTRTTPLSPPPWKHCGISGKRPGRTAQAALT